MFKKLPKLLLILLAFFILIVAFVVVSASLFQARDSKQQTVHFVIPKGQALSVIASRLEEEGLIKSQWAFRFAVYKNDLANQIQAGSFDLSTSMDIWEIAQALTVGTDDIWITLPEGWRREEIAESLVNQGLENFKKEEFLSLSKGLEGQLFPDTYLVPREVTSSTLISLLKNTFTTKVSNGLSEQIAQSELSLNEILTLASLVQRESADEEEMSLVAQILLNRLAIGMPLQVDATLQYITGYNSTEATWWSTPTTADKQLDSLYNTYKYSGLPPGPICNPGLVAIKAVLKPSATSALYYIHDTSGQIHTANTLQEHESNVNKYLR